MTHHPPNLSSQLIAAYQAMRPVLLREQRIRRGGWVCLSAALTTAWLGGTFFPHGGLVVSCIIGVLCGGIFRLVARPIQHRWRWLAVGSALAGVLALDLFTSGHFAFRWPTELLPLALAGVSAWWFSFRLPTQDEIIQRARQLSPPSKPAP